MQRNVSSSSSSSTSSGPFPHPPQQGYMTYSIPANKRRGAELSPDQVDSKPQVGRAKKTKGRVKIKMEFIDNKLRRYTTFSKRKTGIMKKVNILVILATCYHLDHIVRG